MVSITELMQYGSRRKIDAIAAKLGYAKAEEYPDEVLEAVRKQLGKQETVSEKAHHAADQESATGAAEDLKSIQAAAENRAAGLLVSLDALTMMHCATRKFSDSKLQAAVDESQNRLKQVLTGFANYYDPDYFLAQTPLAAQKLGGNGSTTSPKSPNGSLSASEPNAIAIDSSPS